MRPAEDVLTDPAERPVALVTGGSRGIGSATVLRLARAGYDVGFCYRSREQDAAAVQQAAADSGARCLAIQTDVTDPAAVGGFVRRVESELGPIEAVATCAGIVHDRPIVTMSDEEWTSVLHTNVDGAFFTCRAALFGMLKRRRGAVVTLSSVAGRYGNVGQANYSASKAALIAFTMAIAKEVGRYGVRVNTVAPGLIDTEMTAAVPGQVLTRSLSKVPLGRLGTADEVADMIEFLVSDRATYVTGQIFAVDGGLVL
jgi:3-oxoacyl-[acyl-carrier protein] reductase